MAKAEQKIKFIYDLTPMQEGMLFNYLHHPESNAYLEVTEILVDGKIDFQLFEKAFNDLVNRHDILRTIFAYTKVAKPRQVVLNSREVTVQFVDFSQEKNADFLAGEYIHHARHKQFDLAKEVLIRLSVIQLPDTKLRIIWSFHHIIMDGWCFSILLNDFFQLYAARISGRDHQLPPPVDFGVYLKWLAQQKKDVSSAFWKEKMDLNNPASSLKNRKPGYETERIHEVKNLLLPAHLKAQIEQYVAANQTSVNIYLQTLWSVLLQKLNNTSSSFFGSVVSGRPPEIPNVESILGLFINTIPVCADFTNVQTFKQALEQIQNFYNLSHKHDYFPLAEILSYAPVNRRFLEHIFVYEALDKDIPNSKGEVNLGFSMTEMAMHEQTDLDLDITVFPTDDSLFFKFSFNANLFSIKEITSYQEKLVLLLTQTLENPDISLAELDILSATEKNELQQFNPAPVDYPLEECFVSLFEKQAISAPNKTALVFKDKSLSYAELNTQSNQLAHFLLQEHQLKAEDLVAVQLPKSLDLLVAVLGVMKTGAAYVPIDPDYPQERIDYMLSDSQAKLVLDEAFVSRFLTVRNTYTTENTAVSIKNSDLAYVIYTSGSTGLPKGVMVEQHSLVNVAQAWQKAYGLDSMEVNLLQMASFSFDVFVGDMLRTFVNGGTMVLCPPDWRLDPVNLSQALIDNKISLLEATPGLIIPLMDYVWEQKIELPDLKLLILGSDTCPLSAFTLLQERFGKQIRIVNSYGVTEATIDSSFFEGEVLGQNLPIGKPLQNTQYFVLDAHHKPVPLGTTGELYIGGAGIARGYLNKPELTAERFVYLPELSNQKLYKTGDLAYWQADANLVFVGRADAQVKIRGYRIELGEIENQLLSLEGIKEAAVVDLKDNMGVAYLCAYLKQSEKQIGNEDVKTKLSEVLPDYMIPAYFVQVDNIPLTPNGKVDKKALPAPDASLALANSYEAPRNETEEKLAAIWQEILGVERIGINDNFFELGGHSLKAMVLVSRIHKELEVKISLQKLFELPTIAGIAGEITGGDKSSYQAIVPIPEQAHYALSSAQKRLWILDKIQGGSVDYNIFSLLSFDRDVKFEVLERAFTQLLARHESLRTTFIEIDDEPRQIIHSKVDFSLGFIDVSNRSDKQAFIEDEFRKFSSFSFDLAHDLLLRAVLVKEHDSKWHLMLNMHHIISDGWSIAILESELLQIYQALAEDKTADLPPLPIQYRDYAAWQQQLIAGSGLEGARQFWHQTFMEGKNIPVMELPFDYQQSNVKDNTGSQFIHQLDSVLSKQLLALAREKQSSLFMVLLSAFGILINKLTQSTDILIGTPVAGRGHEDLKRLIGFFLNTVVLRFRIEEKQSAQDFLSAVKKQTLLSLQHQDYPFEQLVDDLQIPRDINRFPLTSVFFNMLNLEEEKPGRMVETEAKHLIHNHQVKFDLNIYAKEYENGIELIWDYKNELFSPQSIELFAGQFTSILEQISLHPEISLHSLQTGCAEAKQHTIPVNSSENLQTRLQNSFKCFASRIAIGGKTSMSYTELNEKSNRLACYLAQTTQKKRIAFCLDHGYLPALAITSILKSGNSYVPLDADSPLHRLQFSIEECKPALVLCDEANLTLVQQLFAPGQIICLDKKDAAYLRCESSDFYVASSKDDEAYVLYTSGSSGQPKGVRQTIGGMLHFANLYIGAIQLTEIDRLSGFSSVSFDSYNHEFLPALLSGASYWPVSLKSDLGIHQLADFVEQNQLTIWQSVPTVFRQFTDYIKDENRIFKNLRIVKMTGEASRKDDFEAFKGITTSDSQFAVSYGSTENSLSTFNLLTHQNKVTKTNLAAGKVLPNTEILLLDAEFRAVDFLQAGEVFLHSAGTTSGYLNDELNQEAFVELEGKRFFRTGDSGKINLSGELELLGRKDGQLKIRGMRIELGEIESILYGFDEIEQAVVQALEFDGQLKLIAYYQSKEEADSNLIKRKLSSLLPTHMLPDLLVHVNQFPLTISGKIDRKALPVPSVELWKTRNEYRAPETDLQEQLIQLWQDLLASRRKDSPAIGITDNFFELGGHSLLASAFVARLEKQLQLVLPLRQVFLNPTIEGIANYLETEASSSKKSAIVSAGGPGIYPASSAQKRLFVLQQIGDQSTNYNMTNVIVLKGKVAKNRVQAVFEALVQRHESLRTSFHFDSGELLQEVHASLDFKVDFLEMTADEAKPWVQQAIKPFNLELAPLLRVALIQLNAEEFLLFTDMHHIISDGTSVEILASEFTKLYEGEKLEPLKIQYKDYAVWLSENEQIESQEAFWLGEFAPEKTGESIPVLELPTDFARPAVFSHEGAQVGITLDKKSTTALKKMLQEQGLTLYMGLLSAFYVLLHKYSRQDDLVIGTPVAGRNHADLENMIGMFVNTLAMRQQIDPNQSVSDFMQQVKEKALLAFENQEYPFAELVDKLDLQKQFSRNALFDVVFVLQNLISQEKNLSELKVEFFANPLVQSKFDLTLTAMEENEQLYFNFVYAKHLFENRSIEQLASHFSRIIEHIIANPALKISEIDVLSEAEKQQLLVDFNPTDVAFPEQETILSLFEKQVLATPDNVALVFEDNSLTYTELNALSNQLAHCILEKTAVSADDTIAILLDRSEWMVVSVLAVLKTGGCYVPIDPSYPQERIDFMLSDSGAKLVVDEAFVSRFLTAVPDGRQVRNTYATENTSVLRNPHDLAYIIYTSGSTGQPKGVMIEDQQVVRLLFNEANLFDFSSSDVWTLFHSYCFDFSVWEMYGALLFGGKLVVVPKIVAQSTPDFRILVQQQGVTVLNQTPGSFYNFIPEELAQNEALLSLRYVIFGGEALSPAKLAEFKSRYPKTKLINMYGITETTVHVTYKEITETEIEAGISNIGVAIPTLQIYILDANLKLVPIGVAGELCVGGTGLARGYLNREELTAEKFVDSPFQTGKKLYRSGDLARLLPSGELEYLGRIDQQVKIRGFRIELGEVEAKMLALGIFQDVVVIDKKDTVPAGRQGDSSSYLVAYFTSKESLNAGEIRQQLTGLLPDYMLPSFFVQLESIPLTSNGKVDRKALPEPDGSLAAAEYIAPRNETEQKLAEIWQEVLGIERLGINDNFFELGGHSLKATQVNSRIQLHFGVRIPLKEFFVNQTLAEQALLLGSTFSKTPEITAAPIQEYYELSQAQKGFWISEKMGSTTDFKISTAVRITGLLDVDRLKHVFQKLVEEHESFRTSFHEIDGIPMQRILPELAFQLEQHDLSLSSNIEAEIEKEINHEYQQAFNLETAPLLRTRLLRVSETEHVLLLTVHHIIADGWSLDLLVKELIRNYTDSKIISESIPAKLQYKDFASWQKKYLNEEKLAELKAFWHEHLDGELSHIALPTDKTPKSNASNKGKFISAELSGEQRLKLEQFLRTQNVSLNSFLLAVYQIFLSKIARTDEITVRTITSGREQLALESIIGVFVKTFVVKSYPKYNKSFVQFLDEVHQRSMAAQEHNDYPFENLVAELLPQNAANRNVANVAFALQNLNTLQTAEQVELNDLKFESIERNENSAKSDLLFTASEYPDQLNLSLNYNSDLFTDVKAELFLNQLCHLIDQLLANPLNRIESIALTSGKSKILFDSIGLPEKEYEAVYPATTIQRDLYLDSVIHPEALAHNLALIIRPKHQLRPDLWEKAVNLLIANTEVMRSRILAVKNEVFVAIKKQSDIPLIQIDIRGKNLDTQEALYSFIEKQIKQPYQLGKEPLVRNMILQIDENQYYVVLGAHHAIIDGWSYSLFFERASAIYLDLLEGKDPHVPTDNEFGNYVEKHLSQFDSPSTLHYWKAKLSGIENLDFKAIHQGEKELKTVEHIVDRSDLALFEAYCKEQNISIPLFFKALYGFMLKSYCHATNDFIIHEVLSNRSRENNESMGCFYHTIPLRFDFDMLNANTSLPDFFSYVRNQKKELGDRQHISVLQRSRLMSEEKLGFFFNFQPSFIIKTFGEELEMDPVMSYSPGQVHLTCRMIQEDLKLLFFYYNSDFESFDFTERLLSLAKQIVGGASDLAALRLTMDAEKEQLLQNPWPSVTYPEQLTIHERIEQQAALFPENIAVSYESTTLTYRELNEQANQLANYLLEQHEINADDRIALMLDRSERLIVAILAVLKTGACYVPIDPSYPQERIDYLREDSGAKLVLDEASFSRFLSVKNLYATEKTGVSTKNSDLAYIIYTSGTTGLPKGTMIEHRNVTRLLINSDFQFDFNEKDVWTMFHSYAFDFSVWEIFGALFYGGKVVVVPKETAQHTGTFRQLLQRESVTVLNQIPNIFMQLVSEDAQHGADLQALRYVIFGGDALKPASLKTWKKKYPAAKLINMYGITETTVHVTYKEITEAEMEHGLSNIGKPIPTLQVLITDKNGKILPVGIPGEICVAGAGLARGYLNRPELTAEKFVNQSSDYWIPNARLYRSGDLGRLLPSGDIEYLGRIDQQVKVRGFRIELGEIENKLHTHPSISSALVLTKNITGNELELVAYFVSAENLSTGDIRAHLAKDLPDYMLPAFYVQLDAFPLTANGKIDRKALPEPKDAAMKLASVYVEAESEIERELVSIWKEVLGLERIGIHDNFFELGGHSLKAVQLIGIIHRQLHVEITIRELFAHPSIKELASLLESTEQSGFNHIPEIAPQAYYETSPAQTRLWLLDQIHEGTADYNMPGAFVFERKIDAQLLQQAFVQLIERHEILRTNLKVVEGVPKQFIRPEIDFTLELPEVNGSQPFEQQFKEQHHQLVNHTFNLEKDWLIKACLLQENENKNHLILVLHHIITDGWSMEILHRELTQIYLELESKRESTLKPLRIQYKDFAHWQNRQLQGSKLEQYRSFWHQSLGGELPVLNLPTDGNELSLIHHTGSRYYTFLSPEISAKIKELSQQNNASTFMTLIAVFKVLLHRLSGQNDIIIGTPVAGREHEDLKELIGFFLNTVMLRNQIDKTQNFQSFLEQVRDNTLQALEHQSYPFEQLVDELDIPRQVNRFPISSVFFNMGAFGSEGPGEHSLTEAYHDKHQSKVKFDLNIYASEYENGIVLACDYKNELFKAETIEIFFQKLEQIVEQVVEYPAIQVAKIATKTAIFETPELQLPDWYKPKVSIPAIFAKEWPKYVDKPAILGEFQSFTYGQLDAHTNTIARALQEKVTAGNRVGICVGHNENMALAVVSALKANTVYVPLDPDYPIERLRFIAAESEISCFITDKENELLATQLADSIASVYVIEPEKIAKDATHPFDYVNYNADADAYVLYTSGSTGTPKGAIQTQAGIQHFIANYSAALELNQNDRITGFSSISYDSFVNDLYGALLNGACYCPVSLKKGLALNELAAWVQENQITVWHSVPTVFRQLASTADNTQFESLRIIKMTGEASTKGDWEIFRKLSHETARFVVSYGSTESTLTAVKSYSHHEEPVQAVLSPGFAINNTEIRIVDSELNALDVLEPGEILIHHPYLVKGYLNNLELNERAFVQIDGKRFYRSFDLGKLDAKGQLHLVGRADNQLKIRGMRVELGEIENALLLHPHIDEAAVAVHTNDLGEAALVGYFVAKIEIFSSELRQFLSQSLPDHMIPLQFIALAQLPLTPNGKIDRKALPKPTDNTISSGIAFAEASNEMETQLISLWQKVLGKKDLTIGVNDNFFELGGHSLRATQLAALIHEQFEVKIKLKSLFLYPTIAEQAAHISSLEKEAYQAIERVATRAHYDLSYAQKRLWLLDKLADGEEAYNMSKAFIFEGEVQADLLEKSLQSIIDRHESLRTNFIEISGEPQQLIHTYRSFKLTLESIQEAELQKRTEAEFQVNFDLEKDLLIRASLLQLGEKRYAFLFTMHHIISDGWSMGVLAQELLGGYNRLLAKETNDLEALPIQYKDYAAWHNQLVSSDSSQAQFWKEKLGKNLPVLQLPTDFKRPEKKTNKGSMLDFEFTTETSAEIHQLVQEEGVTLYMFLLAHLNVLLHKYSHQNDILIGSPVAGRNNKALKDQIGFYINTIVLRSQLETNQSLSDILKVSKQTALDAFDHQEYPFDQLVNEIGAKRDPSRSPIFDVAMVLQNTEDSTTEELRMEGVRISPMAFEHQNSKFDLTFTFYQNGDQLALRLEYNTDLFKKESIQLMGMRLQYLLSNSKSNLPLALSDINMSSELEEAMQNQETDLEDGFEF